MTTYAELEKKVLEMYRAESLESGVVNKNKLIRMLKEDETVYGVNKFIVLRILENNSGFVRKCDEVFEKKVIGMYKPGETSIQSISAQTKVQAEKIREILKKYNKYEKYESAINSLKLEKIKPKIRHPEIDRNIGKGFTLEALGKLTETEMTREAVRQYLRKTGQYELWNEGRFRIKFGIKENTAYEMKCAALNRNQNEENETTKYPKYAGITGTPTEKLNEPLQIANATKTQMDLVYITLQNFETKSAGEVSRMLGNPYTSDFVKAVAKMHNFKVID